MQFGFKDKHSSFATSVVLETVNYYCSNGGVVYGLALDATKAFDKVILKKVSTLFRVYLGLTAVLNSHNSHKCLYLRLTPIS